MSYSERPRNLLFALQRGRSTPSFVWFGMSPPKGYNTPVMLSKDLLDILVCPACKQALEYRQNPESLKCTHCHRVYRVEDNIPIMLVDEATIEV